MQTRVMGRVSLLAFALLIASGHSAQAAPLDGGALSLPWGTPFVGLLLTIATGPLLFPNFWHAHYGKITALWSAMALAPIVLVHGITVAAATFVHAVLAEYLSFIVLLNRNCPMLKKSRRSTPTAA